MAAMRSNANHQLPRILRRLAIWRTSHRISIHFFYFQFFILFWPVLHPMPNPICLGTTQSQNAIVRQRFMLMIPFARQSNQLISRQRPRPSPSCRPASVLLYLRLHMGMFLPSGVFAYWPSIFIIISFQFTTST